MVCLVCLVRTPLWRQETQNGTSIWMNEPVSSARSRGSRADDVAKDELGE